jgi:molybdopterin/thiamine biosynthesis adenylyltransferase
MVQKTVARTMINSDPPVGPCSLRLPSILVARMRQDLSRRHPFALERVGFLTAGSGQGEDGELVIVGADYTSLHDDEYVPSRGAGTRIGGGAIRRALETATQSKRGVFHVHLHPHDGDPRFSPTDRTEQPRFVDSLRVVAPTVPHGMIVLSRTSASAWIWISGSPKPVVPRRLTMVGYPLVVHDYDLAELNTGGETSDFFARQSFLGPDSQRRIRSIRVGIVGYGGGGSHIGQQLAHVGFSHLRVFDADQLDDTNHNRLIGGTFEDVAAETPKHLIARRVVNAINPHADVRTFGEQWQSRPEVLRSCDVILGCVDTFAGRHELEVLCRRYCIPYIDIGMDVHQIAGAAPRMAGQLFLSMPGRLCMQCAGILTEARLAQEAAKYGDTGGRPQVVWPNGILASSAVGVLTDLVTGWTREQERSVYLSYDGNTGTLAPHVRLKYLSSVTCPHYPLAQAGDPIFKAATA